MPAFVCPAGAQGGISACSTGAALSFVATPVGGAAAPEQTLVPADAHRPGSVVLDMVYEPLQTRLLREAAAAGCAIIPGIEMLVAQATVQFETWTGLEAPLEEMRETAMLVARKRQEGAAPA